MAINIPKLTGIIKVPDEFASIVGIEAAQDCVPGQDHTSSIIYRINYIANMVECIRNECLTVKISVYGHDPIPTTSMFDGASSSEEMRFAIEGYFGRQKNDIHTARKDPIIKRKSDVTSSLSNDSAMLISANPKLAHDLLGTKRVQVAIPSAAISSIEPSAVLSVSNVASDTPYTASFRSAALKAILIESIDPSTIGNAPFPLNTHLASIQGIDRRSGFTPARYQTAQMKAAYDTPASIVLRSVLNNDARRTINQSPALTTLMNKFWVDKVFATSTIEESFTRYQVVDKIVPKVWVEITEELKLDDNKLADSNDLYFLFELLDNQGKVRNVSSLRVDHKALLEEYYSPILAPAIWVQKKSREGKGQIGCNNLTVKQLDPYATKIEIYRKLIKPGDPTIAEPYMLIDVIDKKYGEGHKKIEDTVANTNTYVYRTIAVGPYGKRSDSFRNIVVGGIRNSYYNAEDELTHISVLPESIKNNVHIKMTNIPEGPCSLYVTATDMTDRFIDRNGFRKSRIVGEDIDEQILQISKNRKSITIIDNEAKDGHFYEYRCIMIYPSGKEVISKSSLHEFRREYGDDDTAILSITNPVLHDDGGSWRATFDINATMTNLGISTIIDALSSAGIETKFADEITANRSSLASLMSFQINRQDSITGEIENMGELSAGPEKTQFIDDQNQRAISGVTKLSTGKTYKYIVQLQLRSPDTLFAQSTAEVTDAETLEQFEQRIQKFFNPVTLRTGTLPSSGPSIISSRGKFEQGRTGLSKSIEITIPAAECNILAQQVVSTHKGNLISWEIDGSENDIDHFVVSAKFQEVHAPIGTVHGISGTGSYKFLDADLSREPGTVTYTIAPVYSNYEYGISVETPTSTLLSSDATADLEKFLGKFKKFLNDDKYREKMIGFGRR
jgi:hypothetical protein